MNLLRANELSKFIILEAFLEIKKLDKLIKEWDDPKDIATRAAVAITKVHALYGGLVLQVLNNIQTNCKHPKKMHDTCDGVLYCMNCNFDLGKVKENDKISKRRKKSMRNM